MNVSRPEQRTFHALARGGYIQHFRAGDALSSPWNATRAMAAYSSTARWKSSKKLKAKKLIRLTQGRPYRIIGAGLKAVRP